MRSSGDTPLTKQEQWEANLAMATRKETEDFKKTLTENLRIKMWCIERSVEIFKNPTKEFEFRDPVALASGFYIFLTE